MNYFLICDLNRCTHLTLQKSDEHHISIQASSTFSFSKSGSKLSNPLAAHRRWQWGRFFVLRLFWGKQAVRNITWTAFTRSPTQKQNVRHMTSIVFLGVCWYSLLCYISLLSEGVFSSSSSIVEEGRGCRRRRRWSHLSTGQSPAGEAFWHPTLNDHSFVQLRADVRPWNWKWTK